MLEARLPRVRAQLAELDLDALLVTSLPNVAYLSGLRATAAALIAARESTTLITDFRYQQAATAAAAAVPGLTLAIVEHNYDQTIAAALRQLALRRVGVEAAHLTVKRFRWLSRALEGGVTLEPTERVVERLRLVKDAAEIEIMREAARLLSRVADNVWALPACGRTEREVAAAIDASLVAAGFERPAFDTIVASGPNSALPHARPTLRRLQTGDPLVLDFGGVYDGYSVDLTRAGVIGPAGRRLRALYDAVAEAQAAAIAAVRPGVAACEVDRAAREALERRGFGRGAFGHGTGHGLGLEVHEEPRIAPRASGELADLPLEPGMIFTVEPGAYVPGLGGVRLEDDVLVTPDGADVLTSAARELREL